MITFSLAFLISDCQKKDWKIHKTSCVASAAGITTTGPQSPTRVILEDPTLNHKVNDRVLVKHENKWIEALVVALWTKMPNSTSKAPYLVKLESGTSLQLSMDNTELIRKLHTNALDNVLFAIKCGDNANEVESLAKQYQLDFNLVSKRMLLETAIVGNISVAEWLMMTYHKHNDSAAADVVLDEKGRNLVHLSIQHKQFNYLWDLVFHPWHGSDYEEFDKSSYAFLNNVLFAVDGSGNNVLHYMVLAGVSKEILSDLLEEHVRNNRGVLTTDGTLCNYKNYDQKAAFNGDVRGIDQQPNHSDKTPRDLAFSKGRKDMLELFEKFQKRVVLTHISNETRMLFKFGDEGIKQSHEMLKRYKALVKSTFTTIGPAQYLQEEPWLNRLFHRSVSISVSHRCSDLFMWFMKELKVRLDAQYQNQVYNEILNGCSTTRPHSQGKIFLSNYPQYFYKQKRTTQHLHLTHTSI